MADRITIEQLSRYTGEPVERLDGWMSVGVLGSGESAALTTDDIERVRLLQLFVRRGIDMEAVVRAMTSGSSIGSSPSPSAITRAHTYPLRRRRNCLDSGSGRSNAFGKRWVPPVLTTLSASVSWI